MKNYFIIIVLLILLSPYINLVVSAEDNLKIPNNIVLYKEGIKYRSTDKGLTWTRIEEIKKSEIPQKVRLQISEDDVYFSNDAGLTWFRVLEVKSLKNKTSHYSLDNINLENGDYLITIYNLFGLKIFEEKVQYSSDNPGSIKQTTSILPTGFFIIQVTGEGKCLSFKSLLWN